MTLHIGVITLLPEMMQSLNYGVTGRAISEGLAEIHSWNPRDFGRGPSRQVDDRPYGGGPGMVMQYEPLKGAIQQAKEKLPEGRVIYMSPQGRKVQQADLNKIASEKEALIFVAGRYEGIDERFIERYVDEEWSLGDFVLSGGEFAIMAYVDALIRLLPGSLNDERSPQEDSFMNGLLDYPHYTRPPTIDGLSVPEVLKGGHHADILAWRRKMALGKTWLKRPDLLDKIELSKSDENLLLEFKNEQGFL